jgi:acyl-CoA thioester hydrolase
MEENANAFLVVAESYCRYKAPARYDDELIVRTHITEHRRRSLRFGYEIMRAQDGLIIAEGETGHVVTDSNGRVRSFPPDYNALFSPLPANEAEYSAPNSNRVPEDSAPD